MNNTQCRMARAALRWSAHDLARQSGVHYATVARFEAGADISEESRVKIEEALTAVGADFSRRAGRIGVALPEKPE